MLITRWHDKQLPHLQFEALVPLCFHFVFVLNIPCILQMDHDVDKRFLKHLNVKSDSLIIVSKCLNSYTMSYLPISNAISFLAATKSSNCFRWPSSMCLQCANDRSCLGSWEARALVRQTFHAAVPVAPTAFGARSERADQYNSVCKCKFT